MNKPVLMPLRKMRPVDVENPPVFDAEELLGYDNTAQLVLGNQVYTLRKTRQNKLLLTK